jgi:hypothetical protein
MRRIIAEIHRVGVRKRFRMDSNSIALSRAWSGNPEPDVLYRLTGRELDTA